MNDKTNSIVTFPRRTFLLGSLATLAACAQQPVLIDQASMADVKRVGLPTVGFPAYPSVSVTNGIGTRLGLIGLVATAVVRNNRVDALADLMAAKGFDPHNHFAQSLADRIGAGGFALAPQVADGKRQDFLPAYPSSADCDAVLDVFVSRYGFVAYADDDEVPYRPAVTVNMRLVHARDQTILMQDQVANDGISDPPMAFATFSRITSDPDGAVGAIRGALAYAAEAVHKRLA